MADQKMGAEISLTARQADPLARQDAQSSQQYFELGKR